MNRAFAVTLSCLALAIAAGCGGDKEKDSGGSAETAEQPAEPGGSTGAGGGGGKAVKVGMEGIQFKPDAVTVAKGGTVTWTNNESVGHDVTKEAGPGAEFSSGERGAMKQGDTFEQTFDAAGKIDYVCTVHPNMTGTVTVE